MSERKNCLLLCKQAPHGTSHAYEGMEMAMALAAFELEVNLLFIADGVFQLLRGQDTSNICIKNFAPGFRALEDFDIHTIYVERHALQERGLKEEDLLIPVVVIAMSEIAPLIQLHDVVLTF